MLLTPHTGNGRYKFLHNCRHHISQLVHLEEMRGTFYQSIYQSPSQSPHQGKQSRMPLCMWFVFFSSGRSLLLDGVLQGGGFQSISQAFNSLGVFRDSLQQVLMPQVIPNTCLLGSHYVPGTAVGIAVQLCALRTNTEVRAGEDWLLLNASSFVSYPSPSLTWSSLLMLHVPSFLCGPFLLIPMSPCCLPFPHPVSSTWYTLQSVLHSFSSFKAEFRHRFSFSEPTVCLPGGSPPPSSSCSAICINVCVPVRQVVT